LQLGINNDELKIRKEKVPFRGFRGNNAMTIRPFDH
jgi:hypothetical protein